MRHGKKLAADVEQRKIHFPGRVGEDAVSKHFVCEALLLAERVVTYRIFADAEGKMNLSLKDVRGQLLAVPQFTLAADTRSGLRPSFSSAATPAEAEKLFRRFVEKIEEWSPRVATGQFGAHMQVSLVNDGPVTFWLQASPKSKS